jgi:AcrR family transcriptional regulator
MAEDTRQNILDCGRNEFLQKGFEGASLRTIAKAAGVTTGAIYGYFPDKKALFDALVARPAGEMLDRFISMQEEFAALPAERQSSEMVQTSNECMAWMVEHIYSNYDAFKLLVCCSASTEYAAYMDKMVEVETQSTFRFISAMRRVGKPVRDVDEQLVHILVNGLFSGMFEIVAHDMPREKATVYINSLKEFYTAGWFQILGL